MTYVGQKSLTGKRLGKAIASSTTSMDPNNVEYLERENHYSTFQAPIYDDVKVHYIYTLYFIINYYFISIVVNYFI